MKTYRTFSSRETKKLGYELAKQISNFPARANPSRPRTRISAGRQFKISKRKHALVLALVGELGSGKTTFIQGFLRGLGIRKRIASPTFIIFRRFTLSDSRFANVYHVDVYRIRKPRELKLLEFGKILADPQNIVLIEWAEKVERILPKNSLWLRFRHGKRENERIWTGAV